MFENDDKLTSIAQSALFEKKKPRHMRGFFFSRLVFNSGIQTPD
jgi:hypothetical protein